MLILDTNHLSELDRDSPIGAQLGQRLGAFLDDTYVTIISAEELLRGWLALVKSARDRHSQIQAYGRLSRCLRELNDWTVLEWDEDSAGIFDDLRAAGIRIGTLDLRIASITLAYDATLLTRNLADFRQVPGLKAENWLD